MNDTLIQLKLNNESLLSAVFLVLEGDEKTRSQIIEDLKKIGITGKILESSNLKDAISLVKKEKISFIISDWKLVDGTGVDFLRKIRATPYYSSTPFIICSSKNEVTSVLKAVKNGANDYIVKPWDEVEFKEKILLTWETYQKNIKYRPV